MEQPVQKVYQVYTEQPVEPHYSPLPATVNQQLALGSIALGTMVGMAILIREIRLLVQACK